jgi:outer membrane protein TolC
MACWSALFCSVVFLTAMAAAQERSKQEAADDSFEVEPPLLIPDRSNEPLPDAGPAAKSVSNADPDRLEKQLERAKKSAAGAERLYKIGVLAKVEVEQRALRVVRLESDLENARLARAKEEIAQQEQKLAAGEISKADLAQTETELARAIEIAHAAAKNRQRAEVEAAEINLRRQQKLLALGSGRKSEVNRAEQELAELKAPKD